MLRHLAIQLFVLVCLPGVAWWAWRWERRVRLSGRALTPAENEAARTAGVQHPDRVRVLTVPEVPMPGFAWMQRLAARRGFDGSTTCGMALRYGIFLRSDCAHDADILRHECVHTAQYERMGSLAAFLRCYLVECLRDGYANSALEQEARDFCPQESLS